MVSPGRPIQLQTVRQVNGPILDKCYHM